MLISSNYDVVIINIIIIIIVVILEISINYYI